MPSLSLISYYKRTTPISSNLLEQVTCTNFETSLMDSITWALKYLKFQVKNSNPNLKLKILHSGKQILRSAP